MSFSFSLCGLWLLILANGCEVVTHGFEFYFPDVSRKFMCSSTRMSMQISFPVFI